MPLDALEQLAKTRTAVRDRAKEERDRIAHGEKPWSVYASPLLDYLLTFEPVLPEGGLKHHLSQMVREKGRKLRALDVAGQGETLKELKDQYLESITAITLVDFRSGLKKLKDSREGLEVIAGDVSVGSTWAKIGKKKFDLITCRPLGAVEMLLSPVIVFAVFDKMYQKLENGGLLLTEVPASVIRRMSTSWVEKLKQTQGLTVKFNRDDYGENFQLSITRSGAAPENLRFLKDA